MAQTPNYLPTGPTTGWTVANGWPAEAGPSVVSNLSEGKAAGIPSPDEVFDMFERGEFDGPNPLVVEVEEGTADESELPVVAEDDVTTWRQHVVRSVRAAGKKATWSGRRGTRERTFADREKPDFIGRYAGKAAVTPQMIDVEYGGISPDPNIAS